MMVRHFRSLSLTVGDSAGCRGGGSTRIPSMDSVRSLATGDGVRLVNGCVAPEAWGAGDAGPQAGGPTQIVGGSGVRAEICGPLGQRPGVVLMLRRDEHGSSLSGLAGRRSARSHPVVGDAPGRRLEQRLLISQSERLLSCAGAAGAYLPCGADHITHPVLAGERTVAIAGTAIPCTHGSAICAAARSPALCNGRQFAPGAGPRHHRSDAPWNGHSSGCGDR